jgi:hypothetical protein
MMRELHLSKGFRIERSYGVIGHGDDLKQIYCIEFHHPKLSIINMLKRKKSDLLDIMDNEHKQKKLNLVNLDKADFDIDKEYEPVCVDDDENSIVNSKEHFDLINSFLKSRRWLGVTLNHDKCLAAIREIENDLSKERESNYLLEGF